MDSSLHQAPLSMGFSRQEYWSGLPFPSPGNKKEVKRKKKKNKLGFLRFSSILGSHTFFFSFFSLEGNCCSVVLSGSVVSDSL